MNSRNAKMLSLFLPALFLFISTSFAAQYNVLLLSIDTLRSDHLGCYGANTKTPSIDALAKRSVLFENTISQVPLTLPSHCTILTGLYPDQHGVRNNESFVLPVKVKTLAELFSENGYSTGAVVGSFSLDSTFGINQGFQFYEDKIGHGHDPDTNRNVERKAQTVWNIGRAWLDKQKSPWFCFLHFFDPHTGYNPPSPYPQSYDGEIAYVDHVVGEINAYLTQRNLWSTTIFVLLSDHGEGLGEHNETSHGVFLYDATLKVPLLVSAPSLSARRVSKQVRLVDVTPTIAALAGLKNLPAFSGQNILSGVLQADLPAYSETYYTNLLLGWAPLHSVRANNVKWIDAPKAEVYDLAKDPKETQNLFGRGSIPQPLRTEMAKHTSGQNTSSAQRKQVDAEEQEKLASLGYVTGSSAAPVASSFDPKDGIQVWNEIEYAVTLAQTGDLQKSKSTFLEVLKQQPDNVIAHKFLAAVLEKMGENEQAVTHLKAALKSKLHQQETQVQLAEAYFNLHRYPEALQQTEPVLKANPANTRALQVAASSEMEQKRYEAAAKYLDALIHLQPDNADAISQQASLLSRLNRDKDAAAMYDKLSALRPLTEEEAVQAAAIYLTDRNTAAAEKYFRLAIQANPESAAAWKGIGLISASREQWSDALEAFLKADDCTDARNVAKQPVIPDDLRLTFAKQCQ